MILISVLLISLDLICFSSIVEISGSVYYQFFSPCSMFTDKSQKFTIADSPLANGNHGEKTQTYKMLFRDLRLNLMLPCWPSGTCNSKFTVPCFL